MNKRSRKSPDIKEFSSDFLSDSNERRGAIKSTMSGANNEHAHEDEVITQTQTAIVHIERDTSKQRAFWPFEV